MPSLRFVLRQIVRGSGRLPEFGTHPGTGILLGLTLMTGAAGAQKAGLFGFVAGCLFSAAVYGPIYAWGCYDRACGSDRLLRKGS